MLKKNRGSGRTLAHSDEMMRALLNARKELPEGAEVTIRALAIRAPRHCAVPENYYQNFLTHKATDEQRISLDLPPRKKA